LLIGPTRADLLIEISHQIQQSNVQFTLDIFGEGELYAELISKIKLYKLDAIVQMRGSVEFANELIPCFKKI